MQTIEEYISKRKKEDAINEFDQKAISENTRVFVNYVFEYFNNYLSMDKLDEQTVLKDEKIEKFRNRLTDYSPEVVEWITSLYSEYGKHMHVNIGHAIDDVFFLLYDKEDEFRAISYDCYAKLIKRFPFLKNQAEMLYLFIKDYHRIQSNMTQSFICDEINDWIDDTLNKFQVNVVSFSCDWIMHFANNEEMWPVTHRKKSQHSFRKYEYDYKQASNLFNLDSLYRKMPKKLFTRNRKQEFEILMMISWLDNIEGDNEYRYEYLQKVLPSLKSQNVSK